MISGLCGSLFMASWSTSDVKEEVENSFFSGQSKSDDKALCSIGHVLQGHVFMGWDREPLSSKFACRCQVPIAFWGLEHAVCLQVIWAWRLKGTGTDSFHFVEIQLVMELGLPPGMEVRQGEIFCWNTVVLVEELKENFPSVICFREI